MDPRRYYVATPMDAQRERRDRHSRPGDPPRYVPCTTLRITYQDGSEEDILSDFAFVGLSEGDFRVMIGVFDESRRYILDLPAIPALNSKAQQDVDRG
jgi:hypothetical protein